MQSAGESLSLDALKILAEARSPPSSERTPLAEPEWHAVHTGAGQEQLADRNLRRLGFFTFYPFDRVRQRRWNPGSRRFIVEWAPRPYFSRYIFIALRFVGETTNIINSEVDGVSTVVKAVLSGKPLRIPGEVMDAIRDRAMVRFDASGDWCAAMMREVVRKGDSELARFVGELGKWRISQDHSNAAATRSSLARSSGLSLTGPGT